MLGVLVAAVIFPDVARGAWQAGATCTHVLGTQTAMEREARAHTAHGATSQSCLHACAGRACLPRRASAWPRLELTLPSAAKGSV